MNRAALPFALTQRNQNAVHNGVLMFLFDADSISNVYYQITSETCKYYKVDMFGAVSASYTPGIVPNKCEAVEAYAQEASHRIAVAPMSALTEAYSALNYTKFT